MARFLSVLFWNAAFTCSLTLVGSESIRIKDAVLDVPLSWSLIQDAKSDETLILSFSQNDEFFYLYVKPGGVQLKEMVSAESQILSEQVELIGSFSWNRMDIVKTDSESGKSTYASAYQMEYSGNSYYGYSGSSSSEAAKQNVDDFLSRMSTFEENFLNSLTGLSFLGKKYYIGFGDNLSGFMGNEVKYDISHTHDIFTKSVGGDYIGKKIVGDGQGEMELREEWKQLKNVMTKDDMYVQYSSGHGSTGGLMFGVSYDNIRDFALSLPAKEVIIFIMSCYSGNLVESFNARMDDWREWGSQGRSLMVLASSHPNEKSLTGPRTDPDEPGGPDGSAGSAFGHALWKALIGYADGHQNGLKDGFISLGEVIDFTTWKTKKVGRHVPVSTGTFHSNLIMNRVPSKAFIEALVGSTEGLDDNEIVKLIQKLDSELRIQ